MHAAKIEDLYDVTPGDGRAPSDVMRALFEFNPDQLRGPDGKWIDAGGGAAPDPAVVAGADAIAAMDADTRDNMEPWNAPGGVKAYNLYEGRKLAPKETGKLKKVTDRNTLTLNQEYDAVINVGGRVYGVSKFEDPDADDDNTDDDGNVRQFVYAYTPLDAPSLKMTETTTAAVSELIDHIKGKRNFTYDESQHPRDERGRWTDAGGGEASSPQDLKTAVGKVLQKLPVNYDAVTQPGVPAVDGKAALLEQATEAQGQYTAAMEQTASRLNAEIVRGNDAIMARARELVDNPQIDAPLVLIADMKAGDRFDQKVRDDYNGDYSKLRDVVRGSVIVPDTGTVASTLEELHAQGYQLAGPPKDRMNSPGPDGYRDIKMNVIMPNGHIAELQVLTPAIFAAKMVTCHDIYNEIRPLTGVLEKEGRQPTSDEARVIADNNRRQRVVYDAAWKRDNGG